MSGYPSDQLNRPNARFLPKPFNPASLSRMIRKELDRPAGGSPQYEIFLTLTSLQPRNAGLGTARSKL